MKHHNNINYNNYLAIALVLFMSFGTILPIGAQDGLQDVLNSIEANNTTLKAYREKTGADKIGNQTANNLANPEVEFGYGWASPKATEEDEKTLSVKQSFDFPTAYKHRSELIKEQNKQLDLTYQQQYKTVMQEARLLFIELAFNQKQNKELRARYQYAKELSDSYEKLFDKGGINILERNKTKLNFLGAEKQLQINEVEVERLQSELMRMNGGQSIIVAKALYPDYSLPISFEDWFQKANENNPTIQMAMQEVVISKKDEQLTRSMNLPKLSAGYSGEYVGRNRLHGVVVGVSIPLWEGRNTVKHKKALTNALEVEAVDSRLQFRNTLMTHYNRAGRFAALLTEYQEALRVTNNEALLKKAFDKGQLSLINYLLELEVYYDTIDKYYETEKEYQLALAELIQWEK